METNVERVPNPFWDLTKATFTAFALLGIAGCAETNVEKLIESRPQATPQQVINNKELWDGKEIAIHAKPILTSDSSKLMYDGGKYGHLYISLGLRYQLVPTNPGDASDLYMYDGRTLELTGRWFDPKSPAQDFVLPESTYVVSGVIRQSRSGQFYLEYQNSMYNEVR